MEQSKNFGANKTEGNGVGVKHRARDSMDISERNLLEPSPPRRGSIDITEHVAASDMLPSPSPKHRARESMALDDVAATTTTPTATTRRTRAQRESMQYD